MRYLLDTCTFLWLIGEPHRLSTETRNRCQDPANLLFLSAVSVWEIVAKYRIGKLELADPPHLLVPTQRNAHRVHELGFDEGSAIRLSNLPSLHKDPFDRMLICQAQHHGLTLLTPDPDIARYPISTIW